MSLTLRLLRSFLHLGILPDPPDPPAGDDDLEVDLDPPDDPDPPSPPPGKAAGAGDDDDGVEDPAVLRERLRAARERADAAARERDEARQRYEETRRQMAAPPTDTRQRSELERILAEEDRILADPNASAQDKWTVNSNRTLRSIQEETRRTSAMAADTADKADFAAICAKQPGLAKKYGKAVEERLAEIRKAGGNLNRSFILRAMIGDDIVEGRVKSSRKAAANPADREDPAAGLRGKPPSARGDVGNRGRGKDDRAKLRDRLEGQQI